MHSNWQIFVLKYFRGAPLKIYLQEYLTHEYFHTRKLPNLRYLPKDRTLTSQVHDCIKLDVGCSMIHTVHLHMYITSLYQLDYYDIMCLTILHTRNKSYTRKKILVWPRCHLLITKIALVSKAILILMCVVMFQILYIL